MLLTIDSTKMAEVMFNHFDENCKKSDKGTYKCCYAEISDLVCIKCCNVYHRNCKESLELTMLGICPDCSGGENWIEHMFCELAKRKNEIIRQNGETITSLTNLVIELREMITNLQERIAGLTAPRQ